MYHQRKNIFCCSYSKSLYNEICDDVPAKLPFEASVYACSTYIEKLRLFLKHGKEVFNPWTDDTEKDKILEKAVREAEVFNDPKYTSVKQLKEKLRPAIEILAGPKIIEILEKIEASMEVPVPDENDEEDYTIVIMGSAHKYLFGCGQEKFYIGKDMYIKLAQRYEGDFFDEVHLSDINYLPKI